MATRINKPRGKVRMVAVKPDCGSDSETIIGISLDIDTFNRTVETVFAFDNWVRFVRNKLLEP